MGFSTERAWNITFHWGNRPFRYLLRRRQGPKLIVFFPSLRRYGLGLVPCYNRLTWVNDYACSCLYVSDPGITSDISLRGTWFQGSETFYPPTSISYDIKCIAEEYGFNASDILLYGSSQGGFAAMSVGAFLPDARVVAECPQINLRLYNQTNELSAMTNACYSKPNIRRVSSKFDIRLDVAQLFANQPRLPAGKMLFRASDEHHLEVHLAHFRKHHPQVMETCIFDDAAEPMGHSALPRDFVSKTLNDMLGPELPHS